MDALSLNRASFNTLFVLAVLELALVTYGSTQPPQPDEGTAAHLFQLALVLFVGTLGLFMVTADWHEPMRQLRRLAVPMAIIAGALALLFYLERLQRVV
jgi:hypothetical protein